MELEVYNVNGKKTDKKVKLDDSIFGIEPNDHAIYLDVKQYLANQRQGTHSSRERSDLSGSTRKIKRQKGTGTARFGDIKNPLFRGGARVFGPQPRDYWFKVNKKVKRLARKSALAYKVKENSISVIEDFSFESPKTKNYIDFLNSFKMIDKKTLVVLPTNDNNVILSSRNLKKAKITTPGGLNTYEILNAKHLFVSEGSIKGIEELFNSK